MIYGYCRISTHKQNIERQERNIKGEYPEAIIIKEEYTGTKVEGKVWCLAHEVKAKSTTLSYNCKPELAFLPIWGREIILGISARNFLLDMFFHFSQEFLCLLR